MICYKIESNLRLFLTQDCKFCTKSLIVLKLHDVQRRKDPTHLLHKMDHFLMKNMAFYPNCTSKK